MNPEPTVLQVMNVSHRFGSRRVLLGVSLRLQRNSVLCVVGESGCGKTTLLRIIAGLLRPDSGSIFLNGQDASALPTHERDIGFVFQTEGALFPHLHVYENVAFPFRHGKKKLPSGNWEEAVNRIIHETGLGAHQKSSITDLSGGLKQRVAIARALVYRPSILLLDEPLSSIDNPRKDELLDLLAKLKQENETSFLYVTHDDRDVKRFGTHVAILNDGKIEQSGTLTEVLEKPNNPVVRKLLNIQSKESHLSEEPYEKR
ncbi:ABC transporter ATP-binding protein [Acidobacteria bacterium AH-259-A15]|nr:ABC transporter ATP-binding protein [Acidobacteria bacterium AH-259-A15]